MSTKLFSELGLSPEIQKAITRMGFEQASPIQAEAIPVLLQGLDVVGQSQTGSGKTVAFAVPAVEKVDPASRRVQVLVLCPTRELAVQVAEEVHKLLFFKRGIHALPIYGGQSYERQFHGLQQGAQIVIGTPGRVMDHMRRGTLRLDQVKMVVLDEADVMLNMGFREDIEVILEAVPKERQTVFFCATMPRPIRELVERFAREPRQVSIQQKTVTVPTIEQVYYEVDRRYKLELLTRLIDLHDLKLGIIFCNTKAMVDDLADHLEAQGYSADRLHGDMSQAMRDRVMNKFRKSGLEFLVATDVAARGIDVDDVEVVFNYDLPYDVEDYVHRIGRTGRAGKSGRAISFVSGRDFFQIRHIERYANIRIPRGRVPTRDEAAEARVNVFLDKLRETLRGETFRRHQTIVDRLLEEGFAPSDVAAALLHHLESETKAKSPAASRAAESPRPSWAAQRSAVPLSAGAPPATPRVKKVVIPPPHKRAPVVPPPANPPPAEPAVSSPAPVPAGPMPAIEVTPTLTLNAAGPSPEPTPAAPPAVQPVEPPPAPAPVEPIVVHETPVEGGVASEPPARPEKRTFVPKAEPPASPKTTPRPKARLPLEQRPANRTPAHQTRLWMSVGTEHGVAPIDVVNQVAGLTGLPGRVVGKVDIRERHLFADVDSEHIHSIVAKLNRSELKGHRLKVKVA